MAVVRALTLTLATALAGALVAGCTSDTARAEDYARQACGFKPAPPGTFTGDVSPSERVENADRYEKSAKLAAQAAKLDPRWNTLNTAYSTVADAWSFIASLPTDPVDMTDVQRAEAQTWLQKGPDAEATVRAECRKVA